ncbi:MAG: NHL domain-containing protein, partial [Gaiellaceae bacterium]
MTPAGALVVFALIAALAAPPARLSVSASRPPSTITAGSVWRATLQVRRAGAPAAGLPPSVVVTRGTVRRTFAARATGRGVYRANVVFPAAGRWAYAAQIGAKRYRLGSTTVREAPVRLVASADVVIDGDGSLVVADVQGDQVVRVAGSSLTRLARLEFAVEVALDPRGGVAVVTEERRVQHVDGSGVRTVAGGAQPGFSGDGGPATAALLEQPTSIAYDAAGNLFITELGSRIRRVDAQTGRITTFAGVGGQDFGGDGGPATAARLNRPHGLAVAADGTVYFCDTFNNRIRKIAPDGTISTVATGLNLPADLTLSPDGRLYATDYGNNRIVRVEAGGALTTVAAA